MTADGRSMRGFGPFIEPVFSADFFLLIDRLGVTIDDSRRLVRVCSPAFGVH